MFPLRAITVRYADGSVVEGELTEKLRIIEEHQPFQQVSPTHVRAIAHFKAVKGQLVSGGQLEMIPQRVEAKQKRPDMPWMVTIEGSDQTWETFYCDLAITAKQ
jgi:hypothetical protein